MKGVRVNNGYRSTWEIDTQGKADPRGQNNHFRVVGRVYTVRFILARVCILIKNYTEYGYVSHTPTSYVSVLECSGLYN